jgi:hypothetical protein
MDTEPRLAHYLGGQRAASVEFIFDYLAVGFDNYNLILYNWPIVILTNKTYRKDDDKYRDTLCSIINSRVKSVTEIDRHYFCIEFDCNVTLRVSLLDTDRQAPDAAVLSDNRNGVALIVW